jgi:hypothetical protein
MRCGHAAKVAAALLSLTLSQQAVADSGSVTMRSTIKLRFDCETPMRVTNYGVTARFDATLNTDSTAFADLKISGFFLSGNVHFDARLGRRASPAPGGTSQLQVLGRDRLRGIWSLPNNDMILDITAHGNSCAVNLALKLKPGKKEYSLFSGSKFYYCSAARLIETTCEAK